jgi:MFS transporter, MHS family, shikimate and dehydroshikimate transport protein
LSHPQPVPGSEERRVAVAAGIGTSIEWYDFHIYGTSAALIFPELFFPSFSSTAGVLASLATFGVAFAARPIGGIVFGHFGDRVGRKPMLVFTLFTMGVGTALIGALPTYAQIGIAAPIILVLLRFVQGFAVGGEWGGAVGLVTESSSEGRRGFFASLVQVGSPIGIVLSTGAILAVQQLPRDALMAWGWRIPFLASIVLVGVGVFVRLHIEDSPLFKAVKDMDDDARVPLLDTVRTFPRNTVLGVLACSSVNVAGYIAVTYSLVYGTMNGLSSIEALVGLLIGNAVIIAAEPLYGALSDKVGRKPVYIFGACFLILWAYPFFYLAGLGRFDLFALAVTVMLLFAHAPSYGTQASLFAEMFDTRVRYSGTSVSYQFGGLLSSAMTPFLAAFLLATYNSVVPLVVFLSVAGVITIVSTVFLRPVVWGAVRPGAAARPAASALPDGVDR